MKKILLSFAMLIAAIWVSAQNKGTLWVSSMADFSQQETNGLKTTNLEFLPYLEYYVAETWSLSAGVDIYTFKNKGGDNFSFFDMGPYVAVNKYFPLTDKFSLFTEIYAVGTWGNGKDDNARYKVSYYSFGISPGLSYCIKDNLAMFVKLGDVGYYNATYKDKKDSSNKIFDKSSYVKWFGEGAMIGLQLKLGK